MLLNETFEYKKENVVEHIVLENSFVTKGGEYIGDIEIAKWYVKNSLKVCEEYPRTVAIIVDDNDTIVGYCGYSHRGGSIFKIGDRIFDVKYNPAKKDYTAEQWLQFKQDYDKYLKEAIEEGDQWWIDDIKKGCIAACVPFNLKGHKIIKTLDDALIAAKNLGEDLS